MSSVEQSANGRSVDTLVEDVQQLFSAGHKCDPARVQAFGVDLAATVADRLAAYRTARSTTLRASNIGKPDRQLWYDVNDPSGAEELTPSTKLKFLYGDILEALLLFLAEEAGHEVTHKQHTIDIDGVEGHLDAVIDGVVVDVKSASTYAFQKFKSGSLRQDDPFGYMEQLAGYSTGLGNLDGAFFAVDKTLGHLVLMRVAREELQALDIPARVAHKRDVLRSPVPPERCYSAVEEGKSGNLGLSVGCSYCPHKFKCWADANGGVGLRTFVYSNGPKHLVKVDREPQVPEATF